MYIDQALYQIRVALNFVSWMPVSDWGCMGTEVKSKRYWWDQRFFSRYNLGY